MKREDIKAGVEYSLGDDDNVFVVLAVYNEYHWILWVDNGDVESVYFEDPYDLSKIKLAV